MDYKVTLHIKNQTQGGLYEFLWEGKNMRTPYPTANLFIEADNDKNLIDKVMILSENTLEVINYRLEEDDEEDLAVTRMVEFVTQIGDPIEIINMVKRGPTTTSHN